MGCQLQGDPDVHLMVTPSASGGMPDGLLPARGSPTSAGFGVELVSTDRFDPRAGTAS